MPSNNTPNASTTTAPDFSNYKWVSGAQRFESACVSRDHAGRVYLGLKGWDKKSRAMGYVSIELSPVAVQDLRTLLDLAEAGEWPPVKPAPLVAQVRAGAKAAAQAAVAALGHTSDRVPGLVA